MGGQACVLYGAAEFSRDTDIALLASNENLELLKAALRTLQARRIALPPFDISFLLKGHAIHFRSYHPESHRIRIDVMSIMRGTDAFEKLWQRRVRHILPQGEIVELLSLPDLVRTKKTQRDKDWPMIRRLIEADYVNVENPSSDKIEFWLTESRTPRMLVELAQRYRRQAEELLALRPLLANACSGDMASVEDALENEQKLERDADRQYWMPLFQELEELRHQGYNTEEEV
jgi:hypothetical protein